MIIFLQRQLRKRDVYLIVGFRLRQIINSRLGSLKKLAYCVMVDASRTEISRFERRNIKVINLPGKKEHYPDILKAFFNEIKE